MGGYVGHSAEKVHGAYGVAFDFRKFRDGNCILVIAFVKGRAFLVNGFATAPFFKEPIGEVEVFLLSGDVGKLYESEFYFLMSGHPVPFPGTEDPHHMVGHPYGDIEKLALAGCLVIGDGGFREMACAVHLMHLRVRPPLVQAREGVEGVYVAVFELGGSHLVNPLVAFRLECRIPVECQGVSHAFKGLVNIGIIEEDAGMVSFAAGCILKVADSSRLVLYLVDANREGH